MKSKTINTLILFGELFQRGYANGLVEAAQKKGIKIIYSTVGRRDENQNLRSLTPEELQQQNSPLINVPLECGFDLEPNNQGLTPVDLCKPIGLKEGINAKLDLNLLDQSQKKGQERFRQQVQNWIREVESHIKPNENILIAHLMAGGVPRAKIILSIMNRVFKGSGDRYLSSEEFWNSDLGQFCQKSFFEVTAHSFQILIEETTQLREKLQSHGGSIHFSAYGYHGTPIYFEKNLQWLCYTPYLQGFAKKDLEAFSEKNWNQGIHCTVYNCPEILTNSSRIFPGVEIFLYLLYFELRERNLKHPVVQNLMALAEDCVTKENLEKIYSTIRVFLKSPLIQKTLNKEDWPQHSNKEMMELMLATSEELIALHKDPQNLMTTYLSEMVIKASGEIMLSDAAQPQKPIFWIGHDSVINFFGNWSEGIF